MRLLAMLTVLAAATAAPLPAAAQPYEPGPIGGVPSAGVNPRIGGVPRVPRRVDIPAARVYGDTVEERAYGRQYDDSYLRPKIVAPQAAPSIELRATEGRSDLNTINSGAFSRSDPGTLSGSGVTRPQLRSRQIPGRARIVD